MSNVIISVNEFNKMINSVPSYVLVAHGLNSIKTKSVSFGEVMLDSLVYNKLVSLYNSRRLVK